jgi:ferredoxin
VRIVLDEAACTGHGRCYAVAPEVFDADELGHCVVKVAEPGPDRVHSARQAVASCPEDALSLGD